MYPDLLFEGISLCPTTLLARFEQPECKLNKSIRQDEALLYHAASLAVTEANDGVNVVQHSDPINEF
ncbi:hypothetical protein EGR_11168 [Echinococcus granulosus]|uniref:Uncharacterized protein n=1 Tax=Echinococcus granulosus TaxID=6210 RepID=W6TYY1_ECHGR|nr:hypothetical protein EGR_11168 [Echinococcus granulosus]EUB53975.1 hypothetical protein EGR_11168 [Echinococcus granulosus]